MAKKVVGLEVTVETPQADSSVKSLRAQLKEAQADVVNLSEKFGATSKQAQEAAKRAANLKDSIGDAKDLVDAFNPDAKFKAFGQAVNGVTGGFAALQGALGLVGVESENVEKTLLKVQSALALSQGLDQLMEAKDAFSTFGSIIKDKVVTAFSTLKGAIISTGIGALVVGVGLLIANFDKLKNSSGILGKAIRFIGDIISDTIDMLQAFTDWIGLTSIAEEAAAERSAAAAERTKKAKEDAYDAELRIAQAVGKGVEEIEKRKRDEMVKTLRQQQQILATFEKVFGSQTPEWVKDARANIDSELLKLETDQKVADINAAKKNADRAKANDDARKAEQDAQAKLAEELRRERLKDYELELYDIEEQYKKRLEIAKTNGDLILQAEQSRAEQIGLIREKYKVQTDEEVITTERATGIQIGAVNNFTNAYTKAVNEQIDTDKLRDDQRKAEMIAATNFANNLIDIVGKQSAAGKAIAIAMATIDTYKAANSALKADYGIFGPFAQVARFTAVAATIARGIKNVKEIAKTNIPGASSAGSSSVPNIGTQVAAPLPPQAETTQLNQASINAVGNASSRAYVLETDISSNRERITRLNRAARIN